MENYEKRFKEVLAKAQEAITYLPDQALKTWLESVFPELKESEDMKIRKEIIRIVDGYFPDKASTQREKYIAWLEKQDNQREQLINKACDILVNCIEDYMLRRMEVWSEEGKKQTLENIRKKLEE